MQLVEVAAADSAGKRSSYWPDDHRKAPNLGQGSAHMTALLPDGLMDP